MPLWSAASGLLLLKHLPLKKYNHVIDMGCGAGFPLMELAERLGPSVQCTGIDPWKNAVERARAKKEFWKLPQVEIICADAGNSGLPDASCDLIVSNLGLNNFENQDAILKECSRLLKPNGIIVITTNLRGHWSVFYTLFKNTLKNLNQAHLKVKLEKEEQHRPDTTELIQRFNTAGFKCEKVQEEIYTMKFLDGTAFLTHHFIQAGWLESWIRLIPADLRESIFLQLEKELNSYAALNDGLYLESPLVYLQFTKS